MPKKTSEPQQQRSKELVSSITEAAGFVFDKLGFDKATTNKIAERAGVSIGSLYRYFPNKTLIVEDLFLKLIVGNREEFFKELESIKGAPLESVFEKVAALAFDRMHEKRSFFKVILTFVVRMDKYNMLIDSRRKLSQKMRDYLLENYPDQVAPEQLDEKLFILINAFMGVLQTLSYSPDDSYSKQFYRDQLIDLALGFALKIRKSKT